MALGSDDPVGDFGDWLDQVTERAEVERVGKIREQMATVDRAYAQSLVAIRKAADLTQVELATQIGVAQSEISRIEKRHDMLLSTWPTTSALPASAPGWSSTSTART